MIYASINHKDRHSIRKKIYNFMSTSFSSVRRKTTTINPTILCLPSHSFPSDTNIPNKLSQYYTFQKFLYLIMTQHILSGTDAIPHLRVHMIHHHRKTDKETPFCQ